MLPGVFGLLPGCFPVLLLENRLLPIALSLLPVFKQGASPYPPSAAVFGAP